MNRMMWSAALMLALGLMGCDRSSSPSHTTNAPSTASTYDRTNTSDRTARSTYDQTSTPDTYDSTGTVGATGTTGQPGEPSTTNPSDTTTGQTAQSGTMGSYGTNRTGGTATSPSSTAGGTASTSPSSKVGSTAGQGSCPISTEARSIKAVNVADGAALVFTTADASAKRELRQELDAITNDQSSNTAEPTADRGGSSMGAGGQDVGMQSNAKDWVPSATNARTQEMGKDIRVVFTSDDNVDRVRSEVRQKAEELNDQCARASSTTNKSTAPR